MCGKPPAAFGGGEGLLRSVVFPRIVFVHVIRLLEGVRSGVDSVGASPCHPESAWCVQGAPRSMLACCSLFVLSQYSRNSYTEVTTSVEFET